MSLEVSRGFYQQSQEVNSQALVVFYLDNGHGRHVFYDQAVDDQVLGMLDVSRADGSIRADGQALAGEGSYPVLAHGPLVERFGLLRESLVTQGNDLVSGLKQDEAGSLTVRLSERGDLLASLEAGQGLLWSLGQVLVGYNGLKPRQYVRRFQGRVISYQLSRQEMILKLRAV